MNLVSVIHLLFALFYGSAFFPQNFEYRIICEDESTQIYLNALGVTTPERQGVSVVMGRKNTATNAQLNLFLNIGRDEKLHSIFYFPIADGRGSISEAPLGHIDYWYKESLKFTDEEDRFLQECIHTQIKLVFTAK